MDNLSKAILNFQAVLFFAFSCLSFSLVFHFPDSARAADNYSPEEKVYLKTVTPVLYEYSEIASRVSASVLPLQSSPAEQCSGEFSYYGGIMESLNNHMAGITPPSRLDKVHRDALSAISEYAKGLGLYGQACIEEDFGAKESLVTQAGLYVNRSVGTIGRVYREIESLSAVSAGPRDAVQTAESPEVLTESGLEEGLTEEAYEEENVPAPEPEASGAMSREDILDDIAGQAGREEGPSVPGTESLTESEAVVSETETEVLAAEESPAAKTPEKTAEPAGEETTAEPMGPPLPEAGDRDEARAAASESGPARSEAAREDTDPGQPVSGEEKPDDASPIIEEEIVAEPGSGKPEAPSQMSETGDGKQTQATLSEKPGAQAPEAAPEDATETAQAPEEPPDGGELETAAIAPGTNEEELTEEPLPEDEIKSWCTSRFSIDSEQATCIATRTRAKETTESLLETYPEGTPEREIVEKCRSDWKEGTTYHYEMVISCTRFFCKLKDIEACKDLSD